MTRHARNDHPLFPPNRPSTETWPAWLTLLCLVVYLVTLAALRLLET